MAVNVPQPPVAVPQETVTLSLSQVSEVPEANVANVLSEIVRESTLPQTTPLKRDARERNKENHTPPCLDEEPAKKRRRLEDPSDSGDKTAEKPALCKNLFFIFYVDISFLFFFSFSFWTFFVACHLFSLGALHHSWLNSQEVGELHACCGLVTPQKDACAGTKHLAQVLLWPG